MMVVSGTPESICRQCGREWDDDGSECRSCGTARLVSLRTLDREVYYQVVTLLKDAGFLSDVAALSDSFRGLSDVYGFHVPGAGELWVAAAKFDTVVELLAMRGIEVTVATGVLVDQSEPQCPKCDEWLESNATQVCPTCGTAIIWLDHETAAEQGESESSDDKAVANGESGIAAFFDLLVIVVLICAWLLYNVSLFLPAIGLVLFAVVLGLVRGPRWLRTLMGVEKANERRDS